MMGVAYSIPRVRGGLVALQTAAFRLRYGQYFGSGLRLYGWPIVSISPQSRFIVGHDCTMVSLSQFSEPGVNHPCVLRTLQPNASLVLGDHVGMSGVSICAGDSVTIGSECLLGANVFISDTDFHPIAAEQRRFSKGEAHTAPVEIGRNVFIGAGAYILKGTTVGDHAVVAAASVVVNDVPSRTIVAGVPARAVGVVP